MRKFELKMSQQAAENILAAYSNLDARHTELMKQWLLDEFGIALQSDDEIIEWTSESEDEDILDSEEETFGPIEVQEEECQVIDMAEWKREHDREA